MLYAFFELKYLTKLKKLLYIVARDGNCTVNISKLSSDKLTELKDELFKLRFQQAINQLDNPMRKMCIRDRFCLKV